MRALLQLAIVGVVAGSMLATACSPEAGRKPGEPGADVGNRASPNELVELHGKIDPDYGVPTVGTGVQQ
jgi:hypothetical protein